jgi:hypothetical protein
MTEAAGMGARTGGVLCGDVRLTDDETCCEPGLVIVDLPG